jgi:hypothetical protein
MEAYDLSEKEYRLQLQAAMVINAVQDALYAMTGIAVRLLERGLSEETANILAYVTQHPDVHHDTFDTADEIFMSLESEACPRIIHDAREFILGKSLNTMANYIAEIPMPD